MSQVAFLGTGLLGSAFVEAALARGDQVTVWNRTASKAASLRQFGATIAATPADAVRGAERVHLVLRDDAVVGEVIAACRAALEPAAIIVDHTTTLPASTAERSRSLAREGVRYLHCPVFIGPAAARKGEGITLAAGQPELFESVRPALERQATTVRYYGEDPGRAAAIKLAGNAFIVGIGGLVADALTVGSSGGATGDEILEALGWFNS
ncbi:MAG TPA: NAD(P)-binding domain-containing protein, partial [Gemmatimonadales bacterium]|nr:NAD(P)-binding domain-containing protein [Gemmatimonadales bacterium]